MITVYKTLLGVQLLSLSVLDYYWPSLIVVSQDLEISSFLLAL